MDGSNPEALLRRALLPRALLAGVALGVIAMASASLLLYDDAGLLSGATGVLATGVIALTVGIWAGGPGAEEESPGVRERWAMAGLATGVAGAFATIWRLYSTLATWALGRVGALLLLVALPTYALGMLLPVLLTWGERYEEAEASWGALGVLVVSVLAGVALGALAAGLLLLPWWSPGPVLLSVSVLLLLPLFLPDPSELEAPEQVLFEGATPFSLLRVTETVFPGERQPERRLYLNGEEESAELARSGAPALPYIAAAEAWLANVTPRASSYLFLGGGAYTLPRRLAERDSRARITVVELDPEVTRVAYRFFGLRREHDITSIHGDARAYLDWEGKESSYDRIYMDVYAGQESLPYSLVTREAFTALRRHLVSDGIAVLNVIGVVQGPESTRLWSVVRTFQTVFASVALYSHLGPDFPERQNLLLAGSAEPERPFPDHAGLFERWPQAQWPEETGAIVLRDLFTTAPPRPSSHPSSVAGRRSD